MIRYVRSVSTLMIGVALLLVGHGLHLSLVPLRAAVLGWPEPLIGILASCYFAGFVVGCFGVPAIVARVGHVRTFLTLTAAVTSTALALGLTDAPPVWMLLRFFTGISISGLYLVIESWLNEQADDAHRGAVLSVYTIVVLLALTAGQLLLNAGEPTGPEIVTLAALFLVLAAIPVGLTTSPAPEPVPRAKFSIRRLVANSRTATFGALISGLVVGAFYGLAPLFASRMGLSVSAISLLMSVTILGGALVQWPLGRLSDRVDRRWVIAGAMATGALVCIAGLRAAPGHLPLVMALFGACVMPLYALCLAQANDNATSGFIEIGTGILITTAIGSMAGPLIAGWTMDQLGPGGFFAYATITLGGGAVVTALVAASRPSTRPHFRPFELATTAAAQGAVALDPRTHGDNPAAATDVGQPASGPNLSQSSSPSASRITRFSMNSSMRRRTLSRRPFRSARTGRSWVSSKSKR